MILNVQHNIESKAWLQRSVTPALWSFDRQILGVHCLHILGFVSGFGSFQGSQDKSN